MMRTPQVSAATVRVPGSTSNFGAGFDCLGLAVDLYLSASFEPCGGELLVEHAADPPHGAGTDLVARAFGEQLASHGVAAPAGVLRVQSDVPIGHGLGSSAAAVVAGLALADAVVARPLDTEGLFRIAVRWEGHPDNAGAALLGGLVTIAEGPGGPTPFRLPLSERVGFAFAAPDVEVSTPTARATLPASVPHARAARGLGRLAALLHGLATADGAAIRLGVQDELHVPYRLPLIPGGADAIAAALEAGAWGATVSGSGSGIIAACEIGREQAVAAAMSTAFNSSGLGGVVARVLRPTAHGAEIQKAAALTAGVRG